MRLRIKDRMPRLLDGRLSPMELWQDDGYWDVTLPLYGLYKLTRYGLTTVDYIDYGGDGLSIQRVDRHGKVVGNTPFTTAHDGFETIYTIE